jgi:NADH-quinone oxidoreductase subunit C
MSLISEQLQEDALVLGLTEKFPGALESASMQLEQTVFYIDPAQIVPVSEYLRDEHRFNRVSSVTAVDWYPQEPRFEVVYLLHSIPNNSRLRLKCRLTGTDAKILSVTGVWPGANWYEREVFDLFGITFEGHPDLRRIMMPDDWQGHPLRKDFPVHGHKYDYGQGN